MATRSGPSGKGRPAGRGQKGGGGQRHSPDSRQAPARGGAKTKRPGRGKEAQGAAPKRKRSPADAMRSRGPRPRPSKDAKIVKHEAGMTLAAWVVMESGGNLSVREAKRLLESGICRINGITETFASRTLVSGDAVDIRIPERKPSRTRAQLDPERLIHEDDHIVAYDKPAGLPVTPPDNGRGPSLLGLLQERWRGLWPVHRIDADTSGLVIFAKDKETANALIERFKAHEVDKRYLALVRGQPSSEGTHRSYLVKVASGQGFETWVSNAEGTGQAGREAITHWRVEEKVGYWASLVEVRPETGRHHQIRIHMAELKHPLFGDVRYGDRRDPVVVARHLLHAASMSLKHPATGGTLSLRARLPDDFRETMAALRRL